MDSMYKILMELPMFRGVSVEKLTKVVERVRLHFLKYLDGETIVSAGEESQYLLFVIGGAVRTSVANADGRFRVEQTLRAPSIITPDFLFGRATKFPCTVVAQGSASLLQVSKRDFVEMLHADEVFLFNYLNYVSMNAQKAVQGVLAVAAGSLEERIAFWIVALTQPDGTDITMACRHRDLYSIFGVQRSSFIATLDSMRGRGIIEYTPSEIRILSRRDLLALLTSPTE